MLNTELTIAAYSAPKNTASLLMVLDDLTATPTCERKLWTKPSSLIVGAGMVGHAFLELKSQGELDIQP